MTKQHVLPNRLRRILPRIHKSHVQTVSSALRVKGVVTSPPSMQRTHQGDIGTRQIRRVCYPCNAHWLKDGEAAAFKVIEPLIVGRVPTLSVSDQRAIAFIAMTLTTMIELTHPPTASISQHDRAYVMEHGEPPANWFVWLARSLAEDRKSVV